MKGSAGSLEGDTRKKPERRMANDMRLWGVARRGVRLTGSHSDERNDLISVVFEL